MTAAGCNYQYCPYKTPTAAIVQPLWTPPQREYVPVQVPKPSFGLVTVVIMDEHGNTWVKVDQPKDTPENKNTEH